MCTVRPRSLGTSLSDPHGHDIGFGQFEVIFISTPISVISCYLIVYNIKINLKAVLALKQSNLIS